MIEPTATVASILRADQAYCTQLCEKETLDFGIAYHCAQRSNCAELNQYREIIAKSESELAAAWQECNEFFAGIDVPCAAWAPAIGVPLEPIAPFIESRGFVRHTSVALRLVDWVDIAVSDDIRILPARAIRSAFLKSVEQAHASIATDGTPAQAQCEILNERLNDPQLDMSVAMVDGKPAGHCGLFQVGDIARVVEFSVADVKGGRRVADALMAHVLALAKRLMMKTICARIAADRADAVSYFKQVGFIEDGEIIEFVRSAV